MITIVAAMDENRVIGYQNQLPWHMPADLAHFKKVTMGHVIVMGRKTYESIGKPLPGRTNVVLTRRIDYEAPGCTILHDVDSVLAKFARQDVDIIGGAEIIQLFWPYIDRLELTFIHHTFSGDVHFPSWNRTEWNEFSRHSHAPDEKNPYPYTFATYEQKPVPL
ncbi:dihydrofolate reductase [Aneurinibacillus soli]|uniref:Dihydrofolate reductase n=1 Tax=Aneurinibacillus soli TaxID=1500254 RepID=A0A0U5B989_9BACL|nr:dihydrofolate reductase [Aneurinibacillus soli]PYE63758.1 dihydrofolate reductase [Aneurinibacillus soli]BAU27309.1 Dihydrofolate reductase [Aneurinibacillus soli]